MSSGVFEHLLYTVPAILIALSFHEYWHGLVSTMLGDDVPRLQGRLSLNPFISGYGFGWAKPVMVNPNRYKHKKLGMLLVALAGPLSNVLLAIIAFYFYAMIDMGILPPNAIFQQFFLVLTMINLSLAAFNIIPIPPLDGSKVLAIILPAKYADKIYGAGQYLILILLLLSFTGILGAIMSPIFSGLITFVEFVVNGTFSLLPI